MPHFPNKVFGAAAACLMSCSAGAADWSGYASVQSDYIYRGVSLLDSGPSLQGGVEGRFDDGLIAGAFAANVDRQWIYRQRETDKLELDLYAGDDFGCGAVCRARVLVSRYVFPQPGSRDWSEVTASVALFDRVGASLAWSPSGLGSSRSTRTIEAWAEQPLTRHTSIEGGCGQVSIAGFDYWYAHLGLSQRIDRFVIGLAAHVSDPDFRRFGFDDHTRRVVLSVSTAF